MKKIIILVLPFLLLCGCSIKIEDNPICNRKKCEKQGGIFTESLKDCACTYVNRGGDEE